ncbi:MAG: hypothetical protein COA79_21600 [Planctomycetota bacterium]|nr:MAG: hypothetical protein COA79_21600 [Planctomycetota bacterium]
MEKLINPFEKSFNSKRMEVPLTDNNCLTFLSIEIIYQLRPNINPRIIATKNKKEMWELEIHELVKDVTPCDDHEKALRTSCLTPKGYNFLFNKISIPTTAFALNHKAIEHSTQKVKITEIFRKDPFCLEQYHFFIRKLKNGRM